MVALHGAHVTGTLIKGGARLGGLICVMDEKVRHRERQIGGRTNESCSSPLRPCNDVGTDFGGRKKNNIRIVLLLTDYKSVINKVDYLCDIILLLLFYFFIFYYLNILHLTAQNNIGILRQKMYILYILNIFISK